MSDPARLRRELAMRACNRRWDANEAIALLIEDHHADAGEGLGHGVRGT